MADVTGAYDALRIYDGNSSQAVLLAEVSGKGVKCKILSTGPQMFITFDSDDHGKAMGFSAIFHASNFTQQNQIIKPCTKDNPCHADEGQCYSNEQCSGTLKCGKNNCPAASGYDPGDDCCYDYCAKWLNMTDRTITSPEYPNSYNFWEECIWTISAAENQTVLLQFIDFQVSYLCENDIFGSKAELLNIFQLDSKEADYIKLFDGNSTDKAYLLKDLLGWGYIPSNVESVSHHLTVRFFTDHAAWGAGFKAKIIIKDGLRDKAVNACSVVNPCQVNEGHCFYDGQCIGDLRCGEKNCPTELGYDPDSNCCYDYCSQWLNLTAKTLTSPNYPNNYENMITCSWTITSSSTDDIIKLDFDVFKVRFFHQCTACR